MGRVDRFLTVGGVELHYSEWGIGSAPPVVCLHGLSRVGRDFDPLAREIANTYRVLCPDLPGRGLSEWCVDPAGYTDASLLELLVGFCDALGLDSVRLIGTSMGGGLGMALAGGPLSDRISHLVVNDVSPDPTNDADQKALARIGEYVPNPPVVDTLTELEAYYRKTYETFSEMTDQEWHRFTTTAARRTDDGQITVGYDPQIIAALGEADSDERPDPWAVWESITADICVIRGTESGVLPQAPFDRMLELQPDAQTISVACGHAPALNTDEQISPIAAFLAD